MMSITSILLFIAAHYIRINTNLRGLKIIKATNKFIPLNTNKYKDNNKGS